MGFIKAVIFDFDGLLVNRVLGLGHITLGLRHKEAT